MYGVEVSVVQLQAASKPQSQENSRGVHRRIIARGSSTSRCMALVCQARVGKLESQVNLSSVEDGRVLVHEDSWAHTSNERGI